MDLLLCMVEGLYSILDKKTIDVWDNIRLSSSEFTIMAKKVFIDLNGNKLILNNGRYEAGNRTLYGEKIFKKSNGKIEVLNGNFQPVRIAKGTGLFLARK